MLRSILESNLQPSILIPMLEDMICIELLLQTEHKRNNNDMEYYQSEMKITQLDLLLHLIRFKAAA
jgi:hypothetical protein